MLVEELAWNVNLFCLVYCLECGLFPGYVASPLWEEGGRNQEIQFLSRRNIFFNEPSHCLHICVDTVGLYRHLTH